MQSMHKETAADKRGEEEAALQLDRKHEKGMLMVTPAEAHETRPEPTKNQPDISTKPLNCKLY